MEKGKREVGGTCVEWKDGKLWSGCYSMREEFIFN